MCNLEEANQKDIPIQHRFITVKKCLSYIDDIYAIDHRLLIYACLSTWLFQNRFNNLCLITLREYEALSLRISRGVNKDVLNVASKMQLLFLFCISLKIIKIQFSSNQPK